MEEAAAHNRRVLREQPQDVEAAMDSVPVYWVEGTPVRCLAGIDAGRAGKVLATYPASNHVGWMVRVEFLDHDDPNLAYSRIHFAEHLEVIVDEKDLP
jgi:hypothetical protein